MYGRRVRSLYGLLCGLLTGLAAGETAEDGRSMPPVGEILAQPGFRIAAIVVPGIVIRLPGDG